MIIEGKANRQANEAVDPHEKFEFNKPEKTSRLPVYFALLLTSLAVYFKSAFPAQAQPHEPPEKPDSAPAAAAHLRSHGAPHGSHDGPAAPDHAKHAPTGDAGVAPAHHSFELLDPVSFSYAAPISELLGPQVAAHFPAAFRYQPQNDNVVPPGLDAQPPPVPKLTLPPAAVVTPPSPGDDDEDDEDEDEDDGNEDGDGDDDLHYGPGNRAPMSLGPVQLHDVFAGQVVLIGLSELLFGTTDADDDPLTVGSLSVSAGLLIPGPTGWLLLTQPGMIGPITISYEISDGPHQILQTASLQVVRNGVQLTAADDVFVGTPFDDEIAGGAGNDSIDAGAGNDRVVGGRGDDVIMGGDGDDDLLGGAGDDVIHGGNGNDVISGGAGNDQLFGGAGDDIIDGDGGNDLLMGGDGNDILNGGAGDDILDGGNGNDVLIAGPGNDTARGGAGDDVIYGDDGNDILDGGAGNDFIDGGNGNDIVDGGDGDDILTGGAGDDIINGGAGNDTILGDAGNDWIDGGDGYDVLDYSAFTAPILVDFDAGTAASVEVGDDHFSHIEAVIAGQGDDVFIIGATATIITGGRGNDLFIFKVIDETPALSHQLVHDILDFVVGDRIQVADYEISRRAERLEDERFGDIYDDMDNGYESGLPIRITHAFYDDMDHTIIEADANHDNFYEIAITLHGVSLPLQIDSHFA